MHDYYAQNTSLTEEELASQVKTLCMEDVSYTQNDSISEWAFSADTKVGDSKLFTDTDNKTITVCLLTAAPERDETHPVNLRQILFTATHTTPHRAHMMQQKRRWRNGTPVTRKRQLLRHWLTSTPKTPPCPVDCTRM